MELETLLEIHISIKMEKKYQLFYRDFQFDANKTQKITMQIYDIWSKVQHLCIETCQVGDLEIIWRLCLK